MTDEQTQDSAAVEAVDEAAPPLSVALNSTPRDVLERIRVVDAQTGERIDKVLAADAEAGTVTRYAIENGALVREGDRYKMIEESRDIRIEWLGAKRKTSF